MKLRVTIEYLKCRTNLNFEVDFGVNGAIGTGGAAEVDRIDATRSVHFQKGPRI